MFTFERTVAYSETDRMGITHHSNYVKFMEDTRVAYLRAIGLPFEKMEEAGVLSPVVSVNVNYKTPSTFADVLVIELKVAKYTGVKLEVEYTMTNKESGAVVATASSSHAFLYKNKVCSLKKVMPDADELLRKELELSK